MWAAYLRDREVEETDNRGLRDNQDIEDITKEEFVP